MPLEKSIIKADAATSTTFEYKAREFSDQVTQVAKDYVDADAFRSPDFKLSELIAKQAGISRLENDAHQDRINAQVLQSLKEIEENAYKEGRELGLIEGSEKAFEETKGELLERLKAMESMLNCMEELKQRLLADNEAALVRLVFLTARKMALRDLEGNRDAVVEILKTVAGEMQADEHVVVHLSAYDLSHLEGLQEKGGHRFEALQRIKFVADTGVKSGGCRIETQFGDVDATVEERVERTWQALESRIPKTRPDQPPEE
jgi:flagellar assembly protein FliH